MKSVKVAISFGLLVALAPSAEAGFCTDLLMLGVQAHRVVTLKPLKVKWSGLAEVCPVGRQGGVGACWIFTYLEPYTAYARKLGLIGPKESLSVEYYWARVVEEWITNPTDKPDMHGGNMPKLHGLIERYGLVTSESYHFPNDRGFVAINAKELKTEFQAISNYSERKLKFETRFGDLSAVKTVLNPEASSVWLKQFEWRAIAMQGPGIEPIVQMMERVKLLLDKQIPVGGSWKYSDRGFSALGRFANPGFRRKSAEPDPEDLHGMAIVGYHADEDGTLKYWLVKNSWGGEFGDGGYVVVDRYFIRKYLASIQILVPIPNDTLTPDPSPP